MRIKERREYWRGHVEKHAKSDLAAVAFKSSWNAECLSRWNKGFDPITLRETIDAFCNRE